MLVLPCRTVQLAVGLLLCPASPAPIAVAVALQPVPPIALFGSLSKAVELIQSVPWGMLPAAEHHFTNVAGFGLLPFSEVSGIEPQQRFGLYYTYPEQFFLFFQLDCLLCWSSCSCLSICSFNHAPFTFLHRVPSVSGMWPGERQPYSYSFPDPFWQEFWRRNCLENCWCSFH